MNYRGKRIFVELSGLAEVINMLNAIEPEKRREILKFFEASANMSKEETMAIIKGGQDTDS
ncbi:hypothetical protein MUJ63_06980 [Lachnospiraceae bacterium NSJ-143]|nr:hypothetical protein [Lachnospiraceae bacterium NSJ-143]